MYNWIMVLIAFIDKMKCEQSKEMRTKRIKFVIHVAAGIGEREGVENLAITIKGSGEDYARRVLDFLEVAREEKRRKEKEENEVTKWNLSAGVFSPAKEKEETKKSKGREEGGPIELYPQGVLMVIHSDKLSDRGPENSVEKILPSQSKVFKDSLEEIATVRRNKDAETLQQMIDRRDRADQKCRELGESLGIVLQAIQRLEAITQEKENCKSREEGRKPILDEEKKIDFFPQWKPQQGVIEETEEEEEYL